MTPKESAEQVTRWLPRVGVLGASLADLRAEITAAIHEAVAEEREACAVLALAHTRPGDHAIAAAAAEIIANKIRARKEP